MGYFYQLSDGSWWLKTVGKGNKMRDIAVSHPMLAALKRYRESQDLPALPMLNETTPLICKEKGKGALTSTRRIRTLARIFHEGVGESLNYPLRLSLLQKNLDDFHHDKVYQGKIDVTSLPMPNG
jgi:hypothetical protein